VGQASACHANLNGSPVTQRATGAAAGFGYSFGRSRVHCADRVFFLRQIHTQELRDIREPKLLRRTRALRIGVKGVEPRRV